MKLCKLWVSEFKNLKDFTVKFDTENLVSVIIGLNGAGKSNLTEILVIIFRDLHLADFTPDFAYEIEYICNQKRVLIYSSGKGKKGIKIYLEDNLEAEIDRFESELLVESKKERKPSISFKKFTDSKEFLPKNVFGYYSGPSDRLARHFEPHQNKFYKDLLGGVEQPLRPLFYAQQVHSNFVLLAFFISQDEKIKNFLQDELYIEGLESVLFVLSTPPWTSKDGDSRFWNSRGVVKRFLGKVYDKALAPYRISKRVPRKDNPRKSETKEFLHLFIKNTGDLEALAENMCQSEFFKELESTYISELIEEVRIRVRIRKVDGSLTFRELSEGEQQLLMVLGLLRFTAEDESLFLLDEPDTHLNPAWSRKYLRLLEQVSGIENKSHMLIATHDPIVISSLRREQVVLMKRNEANMQVYATRPEEDPRGMGMNLILRSELFGLDSTLDPYTDEKVKRRNLLASMDKLSSSEEQELSQINSELDELGFNLSDDDPDYMDFLVNKYHSKNSEDK